VVIGVSLKQIGDALLATHESKLFLPIVAR